VGYFVLGPSDLYKLTKEVGKAIQNFRTFSAEATSSLETNLESNLQLEEIRKAQRELNEAFSFRRSINVDADTDPFEVNAKSERSDSMAPATAAAAAATASSTTTAAGVKGDGDATVTDQAAATPRKKIRRRVKKRPVVVEEEEEPFCVGADTTLPKDATSSSSSSSSTGNVPADLDMTDDFAQAEQRTAKALEEANEELRKEAEMEEMVNANRDKTMNSYDEAATASLRKERMERLQQAGGKPSSEEDLLVQQELASVQGYDTEAMTAEQNRFQAQLGGTWNDQILNKNGELSPLADIMDRLAILEEEKNAADARLQEEFKLREANEETFYKEKRKLLEEAAQQVQAAAYATTTPDGQNNSSNSNPKV
jgi:Sec-independent protein translocase protein TatA